MICGTEHGGLSHQAFLFRTSLVDSRQMFMFNTDLLSPMLEKKTSVILELLHANKSMKTS